MFTNFKLKLKYEITYIRLKNQVGLPLARNIGLKYCNYNIVGFLDDDCIPIKYDLISRANLWLESNDHNIIGVGGPIYNRSNKPNYISREIVGLKSLFRLKLIIKYLFEILETLNYKKDKLHYIHGLHGGNSYFRKEYLLKISGFDPTFDGNFYREDTDACYNLIKYGKLLFDPKMAVNHMHYEVGGCRRDDVDYFFFSIANTVLLILKHKKIYVEVFVDSFFLILSLLKHIFFNRNHHRFLLVKNFFYGILRGIKKFYSSKILSIPKIAEKITLSKNT